jgi:DNA-binding PadR family transcriptional regulator
MLIIGNRRIWIEGVVLMMKISDVAKLLSTSRQTIYSKIDKLNLQEYVTVTDEGKMLSDKGIEKIRESLPQSQDSNKTVNVLTDNRLVDTLNDTIKTLHKVIEEKDRQINQLHTLLLHNSQLMLENKGQKKKWNWWRK